MRNRTGKLAAACTAVVLLVSSGGVLPADAAETVTFSGITGLPFGGDPFKGADVSSVISLERSGVVFRDRNGEPQDIFVTLAEAGLNAVRVRIWNDPYTASGENYGGGICDVNTALQIAERCGKAGLKLLVDFHYSDFWADPGKQKAPKAWANYSVDRKATAIHDFTYETLCKIREAGGEVAMVQVGNETTTGMCGVMLEDYNWSDEGWRNLGKLFNAGTRAVREFDPNTLAALHFTNPEKSSNMAYIAKSLNQAQVDYDVFATSYYPYWHGTLSNLTSVLSGIASAYGKQVCVAETSYVRTFDDRDGFGNTVGGRDKLGSYVSYEVSVAGQSAFLHDLFAAVAAVPGGKGIGVFYWEPAWLACADSVSAGKPLWEKYGSGWGNACAGEYDASAGQYPGGSVVENESLFGPDGKPLDSLYVFGTVHGDRAEPQTDNPLRNPGFEANGGWTNQPTGWALHGTADGHFDVREEDAHSGRTALHWYGEQPFSGSTATASFSASESGLYTVSAFLQGDETMRFSLTAETSGGKRETVTGSGAGWAAWQKPELRIPADAGETVTLTLTVEGAAGSYGSADDFSVTREALPEVPEPPAGDLNGDGKLDKADAELLAAWLCGEPVSFSEDPDLSADGSVNAADLSLLKQAIRQSSR